MATRGRKPFINRDYVKDTYVQKWLVGLAEKTKANYIKNLPEWLTFIGMTPTAQIQKRMKDTVSQNLAKRQFFEGKFREFKEHLENTKPTHSTVVAYLKCVASFFSRNGLPLVLKRGDWESTKTQQVKPKTWIPSNEDIRRLYAHASVRDRALLLTLYQSGFSEVDVSVLNIEDIPNLYAMPETEHFFIEKNREKTNETQATCLSFEALHDIRAMLSERGLPKEGSLFVSQTKAKGERIDVRTINEAMKSLVTKAFNTEKAREFKTKSLRSAYNSALLRANIQPQELKDVMMGHKRLGARGKYAYDEITIKEAYVKAFEHLSINGIQTRQDMAKLREDLDATTRRMSETVATQQKQIDELKEELATQSQKILKAMSEYMKKAKIPHEYETDENDSKT
jgi:integrase